MHNYELKLKVLAMVKVIIIWQQQQQQCLINGLLGRRAEEGRVRREGEERGLTSAMCVVALTYRKATRQLLRQPRFDCSWSVVLGFASD